MHIHYSMNQVFCKRATILKTVGLLVNPRVNSLSPVVDTFREPHLQFVFGTFGRVGSVANIATKIDGEISTDAPWLGVKWLGLSQHLATLLDDILSFPAHADNGSRRKEGSESTEKGLLLQVGIVGFGHFLGGPDHLESDKLVSTLFESGNDITDQSTLDTIGLDSKEGTFLVGSWLSPDWKGFFTGGHVVAPCSGTSSHHETGSHEKSRRGGLGSRNSNSLWRKKYRQNSLSCDSQRIN